MILDAKQLAEPVEEGTRVLEARIGTAGRNGYGVYAFSYEILDQGNVCIVGKKTLITINGFARLAVDILVEIARAVYKEYGSKVLVKVHHPLASQVRFLNSGDFRSWKRDGYQTIYRKKSMRVTSQDLWAILLYFAEFVSIGVIVPDREEEWYERLCREARILHRDTFHPEKKLPEELMQMKLSDMTLYRGRVRKKKRMGKDYARRLQELNKIK